MRPRTVASRGSHVHMHLQSALRLACLLSLSSSVWGVQFTSLRSHEQDGTARANTHMLRQTHAQAQSQMPHVDAKYHGYGSHARFRASLTSTAMRASSTASTAAHARMDPRTFSNGTYFFRTPTSYFHFTIGRTFEYRFTSKAAHVDHVFPTPTKVPTISIYIISLCTCGCSSSSKSRACFSLHIYLALLIRSVH